MQNLHVESGQSSARCGEDSFSVKAVGAGKGRGAVACRAVRGQGWAALCLWVQPSLHFSAAFTVVFSFRSLKCRCAAFLKV